MRIYVVYDLSSGAILQTHQEVDESGYSKELSKTEVLSMLPPNVDRRKVGVIELDKQPESRAKLLVDPKTQTISYT
jgi:hypothetical protein